MSDEVKAEDTEPTPEILPAKSADKLEIEREEQEAKEELEAKEKAEEKGKEGAEGDADAKDEPEDKDKAVEEDKKEEEDAEGGNTTAKEKKKFKMPNIKAPKVPEFLKNMQKDKKKDKPAEGGEEAKKDEEGGEEEVPKEAEADGEAEAEQSAVKNAKTRVMEAMEGIHLPKISKPAFLKKKKQQSTDEAEEAKEEDAEAKEQKDNEANQAEEEKQEGAEAEAEVTEEDQTKKSGLLDNLKNIKTQVFGPKKSKDVTDGDKEESKELLDKKDKEAQGDDVEKGGEEDKDGEDADGKNDAAVASKGSSILESLRNVASQVFKKPKEKEVDIEAGEKDELLDKEGKETDSNKKEGDELEDVKVDKKEGDNISHCSEKKDPEKADEDKGDQGFCKHFARVKSAKEECVLQFNQLDQQKRYSLIGIVSGVILLLLIIIICCATISSSSKNQSKLVDNGKFVETHSSCGKIQGIVDGTDMFSFIGIPYAVPLNGTQRWTHSRPLASLEDCHEGTLMAHSKNLVGAASRCWRKYPSGNSAGVENCLTLDIFTPSVVYDELLPVVVFIDGDDLSEEDSEKLRPSSALAKNQSTVFVNVNYRRGVLGFLSLDVISGRQYPATSGNYGLGDIISALQWIKRNINHFGGHPSKVTILGRGSGGTWATALTASKKARGLFKKVWVSNGAGIFQPNSLELANTENEQNIVNSLNCRARDVVDCLLDAAPEELLRVVPTDWEDWRKVDLPRKGEAKHSWLVVDKDIFLENPQTYWKANHKNSDIKIVFGATSQGAVSQLNKEIVDWTNTDSFTRHVEDNLGSFNTTIAAQAIENYKINQEGQESRDHWQEYSSMVTDIRTVCPLQYLATELSSSTSNVHSYVVTQKSSKTQDPISDKSIDIAAIFGVMEASNQAEKEYLANMQSMFYTFVREGQLPHGNKLQSVGMYIINDKIDTQKAYPKCDFWQSVSDIVPNYGKLN